MQMSVSTTARNALCRLLWLGRAVVALIIGLILFFDLRPGATRHASAGIDAGSRDGADGKGVAAIPVNTIRPRKKTLEHTLVQPGSIRPWAQAELYAKVSGYLRTIQRAPTPEMAADLVAGGLGTSGLLITSAAHLAATAQLAWWHAPQKDIYAQATFRQASIEGHVAAQVVSAFSVAFARRQELASSQREVMAARESYRLNEERIRRAPEQGRPIELLQAIQALAQARLDFLLVVADYNRAQFRLYTALGNPPLCALNDATAVPVSVPTTPPRKEPAEQLPKPVLSDKGVGP